MRALMVVLLAGIAMANTSACGAQEPAPNVELVHQPCDSQSARIYVSENGLVWLNGTNISVESLPSALQRLRGTIKSVCYSRANPEAFEPHPSALKALDALAKLNLPIAFYWDAKFEKRVHFKE